MEGSKFPCSSANGNKHQIEAEKTMLELLKQSIIQCVLYVQENKLRAIWFQPHDICGSFVISRLAQPCFGIISGFFLLKGHQVIKTDQVTEGPRNHQKEDTQVQTLGKATPSKVASPEKVSAFEIDCVFLPLPVREAPLRKAVCWEPRNSSIRAWLANLHLSSKTGHGCIVP